MNIEIGVGFGELKFGLSMEEVIAKLGQPNDQEKMEFDEENTTMLDYDDQGLNLYFSEEAGKSVLYYMEIHDKNTTLYNKELFTLNEAQVVELMTSKGHNDMEKEEESWGENRLTFANELIDFFFLNGKLATVGLSKEITARL